MHVFTPPFSFLRRMDESHRHPDQAALAARLPLIGARVPHREYWRQQPISPRRILEHGRDEALRGARMGRHAAAEAARLAAVRSEATRARASQLCTGRAGVAVTAVAATATFMYYFDPSSGRRRRARLRDRLAHVRRIFTRDLPERVERRSRFFGGVARGVRHNAGEMLPHRHALVDNETLVARVRSEVLRDASLKAGEIHVDAYEGCVTLRGQLEEPDRIRHVVDRVRRVDGVTEVRSYLHLPGTPSPNKADAYNGHVPAHLSR